MFFNNRANSYYSDETNLRDVLVSIRLLQRTCQVIDYPHLRPMKYGNLSHGQAVAEQKRLIAIMKNLSGNMSDAEFKEVADGAEREAQAAIEVLAGAPSFG